MDFLQAEMRQGYEWWNITMVVFVIFGHAACSFLSLCWAAHYSSLEIRASRACMQVCVLADGEMETQKEA